jgi:hypothetical protein
MYIPREVDGRDSKTFVARHYSIDCCRDCALQAHVAGCREFDRQPKFGRMRRLHTRSVLTPRRAWQQWLHCSQKGSSGQAPQVMRRGPYGPVTEFRFDIQVPWPVEKNLINLMKNLRVPPTKFITYKHTLSIKSVLK